MATIPNRRSVDCAIGAWCNLRLSTQLLLVLIACNLPVFLFFHIQDVRATRVQIEALEQDAIDMSMPLIKESIEKSMLDAKRDHIDELFIELRKNKSLKHALLLDAEGQVVDTAGFHEDGRLPRKDFKLSKEDLIRTSEIPVQLVRSCVRCHGTKNKILGTVRLTTKSNRARAAIFRINRARAAMVVFGFLCLVFSVYLVVIRMVRRPMRKIVDGMDQVRRGRLETRLDEANSQEFERIFQFFNSMVNDIDRDRREIVDLHRKEIAHMERLATVGELSANLAHEVRNPLTGIGAAIQVLISDVDEANPKRAMLEKILVQLDRMDKTMSSFLRYARMPEAVIRSFKIHEPLQRIMPILLPRLRGQKVEIETDVSEDLPDVRGDASQIEQVFLNLCLNAAQAMPEGGRLSVSAAEWNGFLRIEIADTGFGIEPANLEKIFKPFYTTREKGSGLGLPLTKQIVMAHGGDLTLESVPGSGTSVFFTVPINGRLAKQGDKS